MKKIKKFNLKKFLYKRIYFWQFFLSIIFFIILLIFFGFIVRYSTLGGTKFLYLQKISIFLADLPYLIKEEIPREIGMKIKSEKI